jgi:small-conductance mechanosensitive channel
LAGATALIVGISLGLQDVFKDFFSGLLLLFEGTTKVGDIIEIQNYNGENNFVATIKEVNLRTTKVETREDKTLIIPNSVLTHKSVNNWSFDNPIVRFHIDITIHYESDVELVKQILVKCAQEHTKVKNTKPVFVRLLNFGDYGLELDVVFYIEQNFYIEIYKSEIRFAIEKEFRTHGIRVPYPQQDVYIKNLNSGSNKL